MKNQSMSKIEKLMGKGVRIPNPDSIEIGEEVKTAGISGDGVTIHSGCKIFGGSTIILRGSTLGHEGPVTVENCQVGPQVELKGGFFRDAVFLKKVSMGYGAHIREGTILEEEASVAHNVGLKQTILFPFVTLGSVINFCDGFMSGGTSRKDHSEVGSSFIHFNYSPNQDKATASLIGDVPKGVMLNQRPIFLGGQGGIVGPCRITFGTVTAAGTTQRKDALKPGRLFFEGHAKSGNTPHNPGLYRSIKRIVLNNIIYIANLMALMQWYCNVRPLFVSEDFPTVLSEGLRGKLNMAIDERIKRLKVFAEKMPVSAEIYQNLAKESASSQLLQQKKELYDRWPVLEETFQKLRSAEGETDLRDNFMEEILAGIERSGKEYISVIKDLEVAAAQQGTLWLQGIVDHVIHEALKTIPSFGSPIMTVS